MSGLGSEHLNQPEKPLIQSGMPQIIPRGFMSGVLAWKKDGRGRAGTHSLRQGGIADLHRDREGNPSLTLMGRYKGLLFLPDFLLRKYTWTCVCMWAACTKAREEDRLLNR